MRVLTVAHPPFPYRVLYDLLACFGIRDTSELSLAFSFTLKDLANPERLGTIDRLKGVLESLRPYYGRRHGNKYLDPEALDARRCVTILRQVTPGFGLHVISKEVSCRRARYALYRVAPAGQWWDPPPGIRHHPPARVEFLPEPSGISP